jgi:hypothetical protein
LCIKKRKVEVCAARKEPLYVCSCVEKQMLEICKIVSLILIEREELCDEMIQISILRCGTKILFQSFDKEI